VAQPQAVRAGRAGSVRPPRRQARGATAAGGGRATPCRRLVRHEQGQVRVRV